jgi:hypothetical protein
MVPLESLSQFLSNFYGALNKGHQNVLVSHSGPRTINRQGRIPYQDGSSR